MNEQGGAGTEGQGGAGTEGQGGAGTEGQVSELMMSSPDEST